MSLAGQGVEGVEPRLGPYRIVGTLGRGGMGVVYRGEHVETGEVVALKTAREARGALSASVRREIAALGSVDHPGVVRLREHGVHGGRPWYAMELVEGRTLRGVLDGGPGREAILGLLRALCEPLAYLHGAGLVHRDLTPDNVLVRGSGEPVLFDLGIAARFGGAHGREELAVDAQILGTAAYMAPEQIRGELVDARADLYALGCILHEALTGRPPFGGERAEVLRGHLHEAPAPPSRRDASIPAALDRLVLRLLQKRPADRLGYAEDVARALSEVPPASVLREPTTRPAAHLYRPPLAGREGVLGDLEETLTRAHQAGTGALILLDGEGGVGKTRLCVELVRGAPARAFAVVAGACRAPGAGERDVGAAPLQAFRPLLDAVGDACQEGGEAAREALVGARGRVLAAWDPALAALVGPGPDPVTLDPEAARGRLLDALRDTLLAFATRAPLLLVLDDLQWADELSLSLLARLDARALAGCPLVVLGTYRTEEMPPALAAVAAAPGVLCRELGRLDPASTRAMVAGMLSLRDLPPDVTAALGRVSDGNPFFVAEYLRAIVAAGLLVRSSAGTWQLDPDGLPLDDALPLPASLAALLGRRIEGLDGAARALVDAAAVLGPEADLDLATATAGLAEGVASGALPLLRRRQILEESAGGRLRFLHDEVLEMAYAGLADEPRRALHRSAARALEARRADTADLDARLALHWARGGEHLRAWSGFLRAAEASSAAYANERATTMYRRAFGEAEALGGAVPGGDTALAEAHERAGELLGRMGRQDEARAAYDCALAHRGPGEAAARAALLRKRAVSWAFGQAHDRALADFDRAERCLVTGEAGTPDDDAGAALWHEWVQVLIERISVHYWTADRPRLDAAVDRLGPVVEQRGTTAQNARFFQSLVQRDLRAARYRTSAGTVEHARRSLAAYQATEDRLETATARFTLGAVLCWSDALDEAEEVMLAALDEGTRFGHLPLQARCLAYLTMICRRRRDVGTTRVVAQKARFVAEEGRMLDYVGAAEANLGWVALRGGRLGEAEVRCRSALARWSGLSLVYPFRWMALFPLAAALARSGRPDEAAGHLREAEDGTQQRLPEALAARLGALVAPAPEARWEAVVEALRVAEELGFL